MSGVEYVIAETASCAVVPRKGVARLATLAPPKLVLVIEDSVSDSALLERHLLRIGYRVQVATDGLRGLDCARKTRPAAIVLDLEMPKMDGFEFLRQLRGDADLSSVPVIVMSQHDERERALNLGAQSFLSKPLDRIALQETLEEYCDRDQSLAEVSAA